MEVETRNYTVTYRSNTFNVDGTAVEYTHYSSLAQTSEIYDLKYDTDGTLTGADRYYNNSTSSTSLTASQLDSYSYNYVGYAVVNIFDFLIEANEGTDYVDSEVAFSNFKYDSDNEAFYYYSKTFAKEYDEMMDVAIELLKAMGMSSSEIDDYFAEYGMSKSSKASTSSLFSLAFTYDENGDLDTVDVVVRNYDDEYEFTFSNFGDVTVTIPTEPTTSS